MAIMKQNEVVASGSYVLRDSISNQVTFDLPRMRVVVTFEAPDGPFRTSSDVKNGDWHIEVQGGGTNGAFFTQAMDVDGVEHALMGAVLGIGTPVGARLFNYTMIKPIL